MDLEALKRLPPWVRELGSAVAVVMVVFLLTWVYTGNWPPMVVIESGSMEHDDNPLYPEPGFTHIGAIDTGDLVLVKSAERSDIVTYLAGKQQGYERCGDYGDVIIYYKNGLRGVCSAGASLDEAECNRQAGEWPPATPVIVSIALSSVSTSDWRKPRPSRLLTMSSRGLRFIRASMKTRQPD